MLIAISPAKKLEMDPVDGLVTSQPDFAEDAAALARSAGRLSVAKLRALMDLSEPLARLNAQRFRDFGTQPRKPAVLAFAGDTYQGLEAASLDEDAMRWARDRLCILSGLYGVLRPLDEIEPYRLEMGSRLATRRGKTLYAYWGARIAEALNRRAAQTGAKLLLNCASQEYFGAVDQGALRLPVVTPVFLEERNGSAKTISFFAKRARGAMARFVLENRIEAAEDLRGFEAGGYALDAAQSTPDRPVFTRPYPEATGRAAG